MKSNRIYNVVFTGILIVSALMYALLMFNNNVWYDEAYSLAMIKHSFGDISKITAADVHPPLYYFGLKLFCMAFGDSLIAAKVFSILPILLTMILGYCGLGKIFDKKTGLIFAAALAFMPLYQSYAVEIRMYTWASFTVFGCGLYAYRAISENKISNWIIYAVFGVLSAYLHYFAFVSVIAIYFMTLIASVHKRKVSIWFITAVFSLLAYLPWMSSFIMQLSEKVNNEYWIAPITEDTIKEYFRVWLQCGEYTDIYKWIFAALFFVCMAIVIIRHEFREITAVVGGVLVFVITCMVGIVASILVRPVFLERYAVPAIPLTLTVFALGLRNIRFKSVIAVMLVFGIASYAVSYGYVYDKEYNSSEKYIKAMLEENEYDALVCCVDSHLYGVLAYYEPDKTIYRPKTSAGSPFDNILPLSERNIENEQKFLLFMPLNEEPQEWVYGGYDIEYMCDVATYGMTSCVYVCTRVDV